MTLFERVKETAKKRGMTISRLSEEAHVGPKTISKWKTQNPRTETLQKVADVLEVSVDYLLGNTSDPYSDTDMTVEEKLSKQQIAIGTYLDPNADLDEEAMQKIKDYIYEQTMLAKMRIDAERKRNGY